MPPRYAKKIDANQSEIVKALRSIPGVTVELDHDDVLVGRAGRTYWFEIKSNRAVSKRTGEIKGSCVRESQKRIQREFTGHHRIVSTLDEILEEIGINVQQG